jgi:hypothetical protein
MMALDEHLSLFNALIKTIEKLKLSPAHFYQLLTQKNQFQKNVLYQAAENGENYFLSLLKKINNLNFKMSEKIALLTAVSFQSKNCLRHFDMNHNQLDQTEISILNISTAKHFCHAVQLRLPFLSQDLQKAFLELLIELEITRLEMFIDEQLLNNSITQNHLAIKLHSSLSMLNKTYKRSEKTEQDSFNFCKQTYETIMDTSYDDVSASGTCCWSIFKKPNDFQDIIENLKILLDTNMKLVMQDFPQDIINAL